MALCDRRSLLRGNDFGSTPSFPARSKPSACGDVSSFQHHRQQRHISAPSRPLRTVDDHRLIPRQGRGKAKGMCDISWIRPAPSSHRIQEGQKVLYHALCEWVDQRVT